MKSREDILRILNEEGVHNLRLWFSDILGHNKNVEVPRSQFAKALDGQILFDGSSIEGFSRIEESDMVLVPDLRTFRIFPWKEFGGKVARLICDIKNPNGSDFAGCPRTVLRNVCNKARDMGYVMNVGPEAEFFLFEKDENGKATTQTHDSGGYFDLTPIDRGENARREIVEVLEYLEYEVEAAHHEVAYAQHEVDFKYGEALMTADNIATFRFVVRKVALNHKLHATFMPKPIFGINGSGMHLNQSLCTLEGKNAFYDADAEYELSEVAMQYIAGLLEHARGYCAITNPLVNSYKRLVPGYEAPTHIAWSERNRSPLVRVPARRGASTRAELRMPDPSCNPYLAIASNLAAGLDGIENKLTPPPAVNKNIFAMSGRERGRLKIKSLPADLGRAVDALEKDALMKETLGSHIFNNYVKAKRQEWGEYIAKVHQWELNNYLSAY